MLQSLFSRATLIVLSSTLAVFSVACEQRQNSSGTISNHQNSLLTDNFARAPHLESTAPATEPATITPPPSEPRINTFEMALDRAIGAWTISQSAQSPDDWQLVVSQYQDAIALMAQVPPHSPEFTTAQAKINEYRSHTQPPEKELFPGAPKYQTELIRELLLLFPSLNVLILQRISPHLHPHHSPLLPEPPPLPQTQEYLLLPLNAAREEPQL
jgi:hypothetical protein